MLNKKCIFCNESNYQKRVFWGKGKKEPWCAFLASVPITKGHTILLLKPHYPGLVEAAEKGSAWNELPNALRHVTKVLSRAYNDQPVMMASMNLGKNTEHFHIHLYPAQMDEIGRWWENQCIEKGRMLNFLGEREYVIDEFEKKVWEQRFPLSIHKAADRFMVEEVKRLEGLSTDLSHKK